MNKLTELNAVTEILTTCRQTIDRLIAQGDEKHTLPVPLRYVLVPLFCNLTGYTPAAVRGKIQTGVWLEGKHYRRAPDGRITIDLQAYYRWVEGDSPLTRR